MKIEFTILGQPYSKANSRKLTTSRLSLKPVIIKSAEALSYWHSATLQLATLRPIEPLQGQLRITIRIYYTSERPDLDESLILDIMQSRWTGKGKKRRVCWPGVYVNDRQIREKHIYWGIDQERPRSEISIEPI